MVGARCLGEYGQAKVWSVNMKVWNIGLVGCGTISRNYIKGINLYDHMQLTCVADIDAENARRAADAAGCRAVEVSELMSRDDVDIVLNLTIPKAHASVDLMAIEAGKHVFCEKPMALSPEEAQQVVVAAKDRGVRIGVAPDTFLGGGIQTCRRLIDEGCIGEPVAATAFMLGHGHESWHPSPVFYYERGGGPMMDMGPYYVTALVSLIGPANRVSGFTRTTFSERIVTSEPLSGTVIRPEVPTHYAGTIQFENGAICSIIQSFDVWGAQLPRIEIYGSKGSISVPNPNTFGGPVALLKGGQKEWRDIPLTHSDKVQRSIGLADMAHALGDDRLEHRANGDLAYHVLEIMSLFEDSSAQGKHLAVESTCDRPRPMPAGGGF